VVQCLELQFTSCKQEATNCLSALKPLQHLSMHAGLSCYRCHVQLSRTCISSLSWTTSANHVQLKAK